MRYFIFSIALASLIIACTSNDAKTIAGPNNDSANIALQNNAINDSSNYTTVQWIDSVHQNLGSVQEGAVVEVTWHFKNIGNKPLIVSNASASCGCTVAEKPEAPIAPNGEGIIKAKFDSKGREGSQRKDVFVSANTTGGTNHQLSFAVEVQKKK
jgi:hypothetical protein